MHLLLVLKWFDIKDDFIDLYKTEYDYIDLSKDQIKTIIILLFTSSSLVTFRSTSR